MSMTVTLVLLVIGLAAAGWGIYGSRRTHEPGKLPMIPPGFFMFTGLVLSFVMAAHMITLVTGVPFTGRGGPR